jgi:hypothetical protein
VVVGDGIAVSGNHEAGPFSHRLALARHRHLRRIAEVGELLEEAPEGAVLRQLIQSRDANLTIFAQIRHIGELDLDADHCRHDLLDQIGKALGWGVVQDRLGLGVDKRKGRRGQAGQGRSPEEGHCQ